MSSQSTYTHACKTSVDTFILSFGVPPHVQGDYTTDPFDRAFANEIKKKPTPDWTRPGVDLRIPAADDLYDAELHADKATMHAADDCFAAMMHREALDRENSRAGSPDTLRTWTQISSTGAHSPSRELPKAAGQGSVTTSTGTDAPPLAQETFQKRRTFASEVTDTQPSKRNKTQNTDVVVGCPFSSGKESCQTEHHYFSHFSSVQKSAK